MKRTVALLLLTMLLASFSWNLSFAAEVVTDGCEIDLAHEIWNEMADKGGVFSDPDGGWHSMGIFFFEDPFDSKETTLGYSTLSMTEDKTKIKGDITHRINPRNGDDINSKFLPMLNVLLKHFTDETEADTVDDWMEMQGFMCYSSFLLQKDYESMPTQFNMIDVSIQYDFENNELYCRIEPTKNTNILEIAQM